MNSTISQLHKQTRRLLLLNIPGHLFEEQIHKSTTNNNLLLQLLSSTTNPVHIQEEYCYYMFPVLWLKNKSINQQQQKMSTAAAKLNNKPIAHTRRVLLLHVLGPLFEEQINKSTTNNSLLLLNSTINQLQIQENY